jgi:hypothetical protein
MGGAIICGGRRNPAACAGGYWGREVAKTWFADGEIAPRASGGVRMRRGWGWRRVVRFDADWWRPWALRDETPRLAPGAIAVWRGEHDLIQGFLQRA